MESDFVSPVLDEEYVDLIQHQVSVNAAARDHAMVLVYGPAVRRLNTVASHGYAESGVGSEIVLGEGIIGVAAEQRVPIRFMHAASEYRYSHAARVNMAQADSDFDLSCPF